MSSVVFLKQPTKRYSVKLINQSQHVMRLLFENEKDMPEVEIVTSGFFISNDFNYSNMSGDTYYNFNTLYRRLTNEIDLSNDGEVYVDPVITIEEIRETKIQELSTRCNTQILSGVNVTLGSGEVKHFSYNLEDQSNLKELFDIALQTKVPQYYHADGESCKEYSSEDIIQIYVQESLNKIETITYFNQMKLYINSLTDENAIKQIVWGTELTGEYLETYNNAIKQAILGIKQLLGIIGNEADN